MRERERAVYPLLFKSYVECELEKIYVPGRHIPTRSSATSLVLKQFIKFEANMSMMLKAKCNLRILSFLYFLPSILAAWRLLCELESHQLDTSQFEIEGGCGRRLGQPSYCIPMSVVG